MSVSSPAPLHEVPAHAGSQSLPRAHGPHVLCQQGVWLLCCHRAILGVLKWDGASLICFARQESPSLGAACLWVKVAQDSQDDSLPPITAWRNSPELLDPDAASSCQVSLAWLSASHCQPLFPAPSLQRELSFGVAVPALWRPSGSRLPSHTA